MTNPATTTAQCQAQTRQSTRSNPRTSGKKIPMGLLIGLGAVVLVGLLVFVIGLFKSPDEDQVQQQQVVTDPTAGKQPWSDGDPTHLSHEEVQKYKDFIVDTGFVELPYNGWSMSIPGTILCRDGVKRPTRIECNWDYLIVPHDAQGRPTCAAILTEGSKIGTTVEVPQAAFYTAQLVHPGDTVYRPTLRYMVDLNPHPGLRR